MLFLSWRHGVWDLWWLMWLLAETDRHSVGLSGTDCHSAGLSGDVPSAW